MKAYLIISGTIFALMAVLHVFVTFEHWRSAQTSVSYVLAPALVCVASAGLAIWAFRLIRVPRAAA